MRRPPLPPNAKVKRTIAGTLTTKRGLTISPNQPKTDTRQGRKAVRDRRAMQKSN